MRLLFCTVLHNEHVNENIDLWWQLMLRVHSRLVRTSNIPPLLSACACIPSLKSLTLPVLIEVHEFLEVMNDMPWGNSVALVDWCCLSNSIKYKLRNFLTVDSGTGCPSIFENIRAACVGLLVLAYQLLSSQSKCAAPSFST